MNTMRMASKDQAPASRNKAPSRQYMKDHLDAQRQILGLGELGLSWHIGEQLQILLSHVCMKARRGCDPRSNTCSAAVSTRGMIPVS
jgi:hypothetical protein